MVQRKKRTCGMIFHPPNLKAVDQAISYICPALWPLWKTFSPFFKKKFLRNLNAFKFFHIKNLTSPSGEVIDFIGLMLPLLPDQIVGDNHQLVERKIINTIEYAEKLGVELITLGSFTSIVTNQGLDIASKVKIKVTSGNTYTAALCVNSIFYLCKKIDIALDKLTIGIIGATGNIGSACANILSDYAKQIILCSRSVDSNNNFVKYLTTNKKNKIKVESNLDSVLQDSDIVVLATSAFGTILSSDKIKRGAILCDISVPSNIDHDILTKRKDIVVFDGGRAQFENFSSIKNSCWSFLFPQNSIFGCLAETLILTFENKIDNFSIGRELITKEKVNYIYELGLKHGFRISKYNCFDHFYPDEELRARLKGEQ